MAKNGLMATTASFAHLLGLSAGTKPRAEESEEERTKREEQEREDAKKAKGGKGKPKAEGGDEEKDKPDDQGEDESDEDYKKRKREEQEDEDAKKAEDDDENDEDDAKAKAIRHRERSRCAAIFASPAAGRRPDLAAHFAFNTGMTRGTAISTLEIAAQGSAAPSPAAKAGLSDRMRRQPNPDLGEDPGERQALKPHQRILASFAMTQKPPKA